MKKTIIVFDLDTLSQWMRLGKDVWRLILQHLTIKDKYVFEHQFYCEIKDEIYIKKNGEIILLFRDYDIVNAIDSFTHKECFEILDKIETFFSTIPFENLSQGIEPTVNELYDRYIILKHIDKTYLNESKIKEDIRGEIYCYCESYTHWYNIFNEEEIEKNYRMFYTQHFDKHVYDIDKACAKDDDCKSIFLDFMKKEGYLDVTNS